MSEGILHRRTWGSKVVLVVAILAIALLDSASDHGRDASLPFWGDIEMCIRPLDIVVTSGPVTFRSQVNLLSVEDRDPAGSFYKRSDVVLDGVQVGDARKIDQNLGCYEGGQTVEYTASNLSPGIHSITFRGIWESAAGQQTRASQTTFFAYGTPADFAVAFAVGSDEELLNELVLEMDQYSITIVRSNGVGLVLPSFEVDVDIRVLATDKTREFELQRTLEVLPTAVRSDLTGPNRGVWFLTLAFPPDTPAGDYLIGFSATDVDTLEVVDATLPISVLSASSSGSGGQGLSPSTGISGTWQLAIDVTAASGQCAGEEATHTDDHPDPYTETVTITDNNGALTIVGIGGAVGPWPGNITGNTVTFSGDKIEGGAGPGEITSAEFTLTLSADGQTMTDGTELWTFDDTSRSGIECEGGESDVTAVKVG